MKQLIITADTAPNGTTALRVNADGMKPSEALKLIGDTLAVLAGHVATEYEGKAVQVYSETTMREATP